MKSKDKKTAEKKLKQALKKFQKKKWA